MSIAAIEDRRRELRRAWLRGYGRKGVDQLLEDIAQSLEGVLDERARHAARVAELEAEVARHRELETLLRSTLVSAERAARDTKAQAQRESELIVREAHAESRRVMREAIAEKRRLEASVSAIRARLQAALEGIGSGASEGGVPVEAYSPALGEALDESVRKARHLTDADRPRSASTLEQVPGVDVDGGAGHSPTS
jgi:cell division initiation protein